jgi:hypothetical protein
MELPAQLTPMAMRPAPSTTFGKTDASLHQRWWSAPATVALIFAGLVLSRWPILDSPPYVEQMFSHWTEACWLDDFDFDYRRLHARELHTEDGGPRCYMTSVVPTIIAALARLTGSTEGAIVGYRLFNLLCAAIGATIFLRLVAVSANLALAWGATLGLLTLPMYSVQIDMLGMDIPLAMAALICAAFVNQRRFAAAAVASWLGYFFKPSGFLLPAALIAWLALVIVLRVAARQSAGAKREVVGLVAAVLMLALQMKLFFWAGNARGRIHPFGDLNLWGMSCPDLLALSAACLIGGAVIAWRNFRAASTGDGIFVKLCRLAVAEPLTGFSAWLVIGTFAAGTLTWYESRHLAIAVPFVWLLFAKVLAALIPARGMQVAICTLLVLVNLVNRNGALYPSLPTELARGWGVPERSHEYQSDHQGNLDTAAFVERNFAGQAIICTDQYTHLLTLPGLGYVRQALTGAPCDYQFIASDENLLRLLRDLPEQVVVVQALGLFTEMPFPAYSIPEPRADDQVVHDDGLRPPVRVYVHHFAAQPDHAAAMRARLDFLFSNATDIDPAVRLAVLAQRELAVSYLEAELGHKLDEQAANAELAKRLKATIEQRAQRQEPASRRWYLDDRLDEYLQRRLSELQNYQPWRPLRWGERSWSDTSPQRIRYIPQSGPQATTDGALRPSAARLLHGTGSGLPLLR